MLDFLNSLNVVFEPYHGTTLQGNEVTKVMQSLDSLESILPPDLLPFVETMRSFSEVVESTLGFTLDPNFQDKLDTFETEFENLQQEFGITETVKFHVIKTHIEQYIQKTGRALGRESEQALEHSL